MKIVQILYSGLGGHGNVAFALQAAAKRAAPDVWHDEMIFLGIEPLLPDYIDRCVREAIPHSYVCATAGRPWKSWRPLFLALTRHQPDAIILHSIKTILPCWLYARRAGIPLIAVEHQSIALKTRSEWVISQLLMQLADAVVVLTPAYRKALNERLGRRFRPDKVRTIPNGIDTASYVPRDSQPSRPIMVGMASRFSEIKRHDLLIDALRILRDRDGEGAWRLTLAGHGETHAQVLEKAQTAGVADMMATPGFLGGDDLLAWFAQLDIYTHASDGETLSTSMLQAMASGLPILGSNVSGVDSLLAEGGGCGLLAAEQTPEAFASGLSQLARDHDLAATLGARARDLAVRNYSQDAMFNAYRETLEEICAKKLSI